MKKGDIRLISHNNQKKIALINDYTGFGRCSIAVALPIISYLKVQCAMVPTAVFSNHTGYESYFFDDYTSKMPDYIEEWKRLGLQFEGILSGYLGSVRQIKIVSDFINDFRTEKTKVIVDPVMGDHGSLYSIFTLEMQNGMKKLVSLADIITPNLTEACFLTDTPYNNDKFSMKELLSMAEKLSKLGPQKIVITGITQGEFIANFIYEKEKQYKVVRTHKVGQQRPGTGDIFASIIAADAVNDVPFEKSVKKASSFVKKCIAKSLELQIPSTDGVCFEEVLSTLKME